jgi:hypothetical protein
MKALFKRFDIDIDIETAQEKFRNKINNILFYGLTFNDEDSDVEIDDLSWDFANKLSIKYSDSNSFKYTYLGDSLPFNEYLLHLQMLLDILKENNFDNRYKVLSDLIEEAIDESVCDLGIRVKRFKDNTVQILREGSKLLDNDLVDDVLGVLDEANKKPIKIVFKKGLKEFFESNVDNQKTKNVVRDMQLSLDETVKLLFKDKNLGFKHFFKGKKWESIGFNDYQKQIYWNLNEYIDKLAKHKSDSKILKSDAENIIYLTAMFIRLAFKKGEEQK